MTDKKYGLIGASLSHSFSKDIHEALSPYQYDLMPLDEDEFASFMEAKNFTGINVTIPYKEKVFPYLDVIDDAAKNIGAVNTIVHKDGKLYGYNTDYSGMIALIKKNKIQIENKKVLILGTGGTSKTAYQVVKDLGAREIIKLSRKDSDQACSYEKAKDLHKDGEVIINTTPLGMYPKHMGQTPINLDDYPQVSGLVDAVYNPLRTQLVIDAEKKNIPACNGLYMLVFQAHYASELFLDQKIDEEKSEKIYRDLKKKKENIVLTGMPTSGKTTVGKALAESLGRPFYDTDDLIVKKAGRPIPQIFEEEGEEGFREIESSVIQDLVNENGSVIATGGGSILREKNVDMVKANGLVYFLDRPLDQLVASQSRPLSSTQEDLEKKYEERFDLYRKTADCIVDASQSIEETSQKISQEYV